MATKEGMKKATVIVKGIPVTLTYAPIPSKEAIYTSCLLCETPMKDKRIDCLGTFVLNALAGKPAHSVNRTLLIKAKEVLRNQIILDMQFHSRACEECRQLYSTY